MKTTKQPTEKLHHKYAWIILFVTGILLSINYLFLIFYLENPLFGLGFLGFSLFATSLAFFPYRAGEKWAWFTMWILPAVMVITVARELMSDQPEIGLLYGVFTALALLGLLLPIRVFFPKN